MLYNIAQIVLGITYGLYLAFLAPASQRQAAHKRFYHQKKAVTPPVKSVQLPLEIADESTLQWQADVVEEDPWLAQTTSVVTTSYAKSAQVSQLFLPLESKNLTQPVTNLPASIRAIRTKQAKAADKKPDSTGPALTQMSAKQLRSLCSKHQIKWRNARGSKHLTKKEMIVALSAA